MLAKQSTAGTDETSIKDTNNISRLGMQETKLKLLLGS